MAEPAIEVRNLSKFFRRGIRRKRKQVLEDVSFTVRPGSVYGFLGPNGAGKSTTIKALLSFVRPQRGVIRILGSPVTNAAIRKRIGFLPETADYYGFMSPRRLLRIYASILGIASRERDKRIDFLLEVVGLARERDDRISTYSKGMKQRVGIAQALLNEPELLILDEPGSGLDPLGQREIRDLIIAQKKRGCTIFFSSHELAEVEAVCDEAAIIRAGRIVREGPLEKLVPYRKQLAVRVRGIEQVLLSQQPFVQAIQPQLHPGEIAFIASPAFSMVQVAEALTKLGAEILSIAAVRESLEETFLRLMREPQ